MRVIPLFEAPDPILAPDLVWNGLTGDLVIDSASADLQSKQSLATAVLICLQTDRRVDQTELPDGEANRGWPGDAFDVQPGDVALGSKLWLLRRRALTEDIDLLAEDYAREAIQPLIEQGVAVRAEVGVERLPAQNRLDIHVSLYGRDGNSIFQDKFAVLWDQVNGL